MSFLGAILIVIIAVVAGGGEGGTGGSSAVQVVHSTNDPNATKRWGCVQTVLCFVCDLYALCVCVQVCKCTSV